uniref:Uncharacterized protein n=1 Tax=Panagrolaimus sp. ES5 TaxID=591445 RepID=A0AC34FAN5_9BILA
MIQRRCLWEFIAEENIGIVLEILDINLLNVAKLYVVTNNSRGYVSSPSVNYFSDNYIAISYEGKEEAFEAKLSIYKLPKKETKENCIFDNEAMTWKSNLSINYGDNIHCLKTFNILPHHELHINTDFILNETGNSLMFYSDSRKLFPVKFKRIGDFVFLPNFNDTVRNLTFEYKSAENVINKEFEAKFKDISCECGPKVYIIPCEEIKTFSIMKNNINEYCANINCTFEIKLNETCPNRYIDLNIVFANARNDYFSVKCGNDWLINANQNNESSQKDYKLLILPHSTTIINFKSTFDKTQEWLHIANLTFKTVSYDEPKHLPDKIIAEESLEAYKEQIQKHSVLTIKLSDDLLAENAVLELLLDSKKLKNIKCLSFYENRNLTSFKRIYTERILMEIGTSFTVYKHNGCKDVEPIFVIRVKTPGGNECLFKNVTVVNQGNKPLSMVAGPKNKCKFYIFNCAMSAVIKNIYTNSKTEDVVVYAEANKRKELMRFNESMSKFYNQMTFNARSYVLEIPANTSIFIEPTEDDPSFTKSTFSYYETPKYGALNAERPDLTTTYNLASYLEANFSVDDFNISSNGYLQIEYNGTVKSITSTNDYFIVNGKNDKIVKIIFSDHEFGYRGAIIYITVYYTNATSEDITTTIVPTTTIPKQEFSVITSKVSSYNPNLTLFFVTIVYWIALS